ESTMREADDISRLFSRFGGQPEEYREIGRDNLARTSEARWPLLASVARQAGHAHDETEREPHPSSALTGDGAVAASHTPAVPPFRHMQAPHGEQQGSRSMGAGQAGAGGREEAPVAPKADKPLAQFIAPRPRMSVLPGQAAPSSPVIRPAREVQHHAPAPEPFRHVAAPARPQTPLQAMFDRL